MYNNLKNLTEEEMININAGERDWFNIAGTGLMITAGILSGGSAVMVGLSVINGISLIVDEI